MQILRLSDLSPSRNAFVRKCQQIGFGRITGLLVRNHDPLFSDRCEVLLDVRLDSCEAPRAEQSLTDFVLTDEVVRFFSMLDNIQNGVIEQVEVRAGIPRRVLYKHSITR